MSDDRALPPRAITRAYRDARGAGVLAVLSLVFGALTANVAGANSACQGFPGCRTIVVHGAPLGIQVTHRVIAFLLLFHTFGMVMAARKRGAPPMLMRAVWIVFVAVLAQIVIAAMLVELHLPAVLRSLHQAVGTCVWLAIVTLVALARVAMRDAALNVPLGP